MSWIVGSQKVKKFEDYNSIVKEFDGYLDDTEAKLSLVKFLKTNIGFTFQMLTGMSIYPQQEIILKAMFLRDNGMIVAGRGYAKSTLISIFALLYPLFNFNSKLCIISANFRSSRRILEYCEKMINNPKAKFLKHCFPNDMRKSNDIFKLTVPFPCASEVFALPLSTGEGLRGTRATCACIDEALLISKEIQEFIIRPFLTAKQNLSEELAIREREDKLIEAKVLQESDRISFPKNKYFAFSSASYQFQYLYTMFCNTVDNILKPSLEKEAPTYFAIRASYEALPQKSHLDFTQIDSAKQNGGENSDYFKREYRALFTDSSDSYFNVKKMHECTVLANDYPTTQVKGDKDSHYILAVDPAYSANKDSDFFAIGCYLINYEERKITLVHTYGKSGGALSDHFAYFAYLLLYFNVVFVSIDASGTEFITGFNESTIAKDKNLKVDFMNCDFDLDDPAKYYEELLKLKREYNLSNRKFIYPQKFNTSNGSIRRMNEHLQNQINAKKIWFASPCQANETSFNRQKDISLPIDYKDKDDNIQGILRMIEDQDAWINETKKQVALIEVSSTATGVLQYNLPQSLRRGTGDNRVKKDHYSCLMLAAWVAKIYFEMTFTQEKPIEHGITPFFI
jgi:hypothetical protein